MASLSSILASFKGATESAAKTVANSLGITKESIQSANKAIKESPVLSAASQPGLSGIASTPKAIVTEIAPLVGERFRTAQAEYESSGVKNPIADIVSVVGNAPVLFGEGVSGIIDEGKNVLQKVKSGTDVAMSVAQTNPWTTAWNVAYEGLVPTEIKKTVNDSISGITEDATKFGVDNGLSKEDAEALAGIAQNVIGVAASFFGVKGGKATGSTVRKAVLPTFGRKTATQVGNISNIATNAVIQASPQIIPVVYDYFKNNKDKPEAFTEAGLITLGQQVATMLPIGAIKGKSKGSLSKIANEGVSYERYKGKSEPVTTLPETNPNPTFTPNEKVISDMYREGRIPASQLDLDTRLTPDQKIFTVSKLQGNAEPITGDNSKLFTRKSTLSDISKQKLEPNVTEIPTNETQIKNTEPKTTEQLPGGLKQVAEESTIQNPTVEMKIEKGSKARGFLNANINLQGFLNNLLFKDKDGRVISGDAYLEQARGVANSVARKIIAPVEDILSSLTKNEKFGNKKVTIDTKDLIGGKTYEGTDITPKNYLKVAETFNGIKDQNIGQKHTILENDPRVILQQKSFLYDVLKGDQAKLDKYLTADEQLAFSKLDQLEKETYQKYAKDLVDEGYLSDIDVANEYVRYVMGRKNYERAVKDMHIKNQPLQVKLADGKSYRTFDNIDDLMQFYQYNANRIKHGKVSEIHPDEANLASVLKDKADKQFDIYRTHGSVNRLMSYGESIGNLFGDRFKSDLFESIAKSEDPNVKAYADQLFLSDKHQNVVQEAYGIKQPDTLLKKASRAGTISAIYGNIKPLVSAITSSIPKTASVLITNLIDSKGDPRQMLAGLRATILKSQEVKNTLASEGFTTGYEPGGEKSPTNSVMAWSSGVPAENAAKSVIALSSMHSQLKKNGINVGTKSEDIVNAWNKFKKEKPSEYRQAHESVIKNTRLISDVSDSAKLQTAYVRDYLGPVKTYVIQQTKSGFDDLVDSVTLNLLKKPGYENIPKDALKRTLARGLAATGGYALSQLFAGDTENQELRDEKQYWINSDFFYNPYELLKSSFGLNGVSTIPLNMISDIVQTLSDLKDPPLAARTLIRGLSQDLGAIRTAETFSRELTGKSLSEWILGYDPNNMTEAGISKGNEYSPDTIAKMLRLAGFNENYREEQFARDKLDEIIPKEWSAKTMLSTWARNFPGVQQYNNIDQALGTFENRVKGLNAYNTAKQIDGSVTLQDALDKSGLDKNIQNQISRKINEKMNEIMKNNADIKVAYGKDFDALMNKGLEMPINRLKDVDPVMYNNIVSIISTAQAAEENPSNAIAQWKEYTPQEAGMIAQYQKVAPLETSLSNEVGKRINDAYSTIDKVTTKDETGKTVTGFITGGREKLDEALGKVNKMAEFFASVRDDMGVHEKGVSLHSNNIQSKLNSIQTLQAQGALPLDYLDGFPFLRTLVKNGLQLKGEEITPTNVGTTTSQEVSVPVAQASGNGMNLSAIAGAYKTPKIPELKYQEREIEPLIKQTSQKTLSQLMNERKSQKAPAPKKSKVPKKRNTLSKIARQKSGKR